MASEEGCVTITWEIGNFDFFLKAKEYSKLWSPAGKVENDYGNARVRLDAFLNSPCIVFKKRWLVGSFPDDRCEMSLISSCGEVPLTKGTESFFLNKCDLFGQNRQSTLPNDTLTLCCWIWGKSIKTSEIRFSSVLHSWNYLWNIEDLGSSSFHDIDIKQDNVMLHVNLKMKDEEDAWQVLVSEVHSVDCCLYYFVDCALAITDGRGRVIDDKISLTKPKWGWDIEIFPNTTSIDLQLESIITLHKGYQEQLKLHSPTEIEQRKNVSEAGPYALGNDVLHLYRESAADKYDVPLLKEKCAAILKAGLTSDNACEALDLADKHSDQELEKCVVNFILEHDEVVSSDQWKQLEKNNSPLTSKIAGQLFLKKGKK